MFFDEVVNFVLGMEVVDEFVTDLREGEEVEMGTVVTGLDDFGIGSFIDDLQCEGEAVVEGRGSSGYSFRRRDWPLVAF